MRRIDTARKIDNIIAKAKGKKLAWYDVRDLINEEGISYATLHKYVAIETSVEVVPSEYGYSFDEIIKRMNHGVYIKNLKILEDGLAHKMNTIEFYTIVGLK